MKKSTEISDELRSISPVLAEIEKVNVFQVPEGYFIDLDEKIATNVFLNQNGKTGLQKVPEGYFDSLSTKILSRIKEEESAESEIKSISPSLHYLKEENVFTVPEGYFDDLSDRILNRINGQNAKVVPLASAKNWWKYAAAAVVAGIITITSLQILKTPDSDSGKTVATAPESIPAYVQLASKYKTAKQLDQGIASLTDDEIAKYLEKNTTILDDEALTKNTDTKELPSPDDYLIDEHALDNYLQKINAESTNKNTQ
jgi:hypothetical protein